MKQEFYDRLAAPFETSERKKNCLLRVNHILTGVVYLVYPALLFYLMVYRDSRFWRVLRVSGGDLCVGESVPQEVQCTTALRKMAGETADPERHKRKFVPEQTCIFHLYHCHGSMVCVPSVWSNSLCGGGVSGSGESDWQGTFCERCGGRSTDCSGMWNPELLGDIKSEEKVRYHEDWKRKGVPISPELIGLFFEDINFAADGGLYAEMIENRSFEAREAYGTSGEVSMRWMIRGMPGSPVLAKSGEAGSVYAVCDRHCRCQMANPHYLRFTAKAAGSGFCKSRHTMGSVWRKIIGLSCVFLCTVCGV